MPSEMRLLSHALQAIKTAYYKKEPFSVMQNRYSRWLLLPMLLLFVGCQNRTPTSSAPAPSPTTTSPVTKVNTADLFVDVTRQAGLNYKWEPLGKRPLNILQTIGNGAAFLDYNQDGNLDILLVGVRLALYLGDGKGHFTDVSEKMGLSTLKGHFLGCTVGDYDNDGYPDIYITAYRGGVLLHNEQGQRFTDVTAQSGLVAQKWASSATFVDIDNDGKLDLYIGNYAVFDSNTKPQLCDFNGKMSSCGPRFYVPEKGMLFHNEGSGRFKDITQTSGVLSVNGKALGVAAVDYNDSGYASIAIANDEMAGDLLTNKKGKFTNDGAGSATAYDRESNVHGGMGIDWGDYDNDGHFDLAVATFRQEPKNIYHNLGKGIFEERSTEVGIAIPTMPNVAFGIKWFDYDNDGWLDLAIANGHVQDNIAEVENARYRQKSQLFHNEGGKTFAEVSAQMGSAFQKEIVGRGLAVGDFDNDGRVDMLIVDSEGEPLLLHNEVPSQGHWLGLKLVGKSGNRDGIGAIVTIEAGGHRYTRRCATDGSYMSASDVRVHCGVGSATQAKVTIKWLGGKVSTYPDVPIDRYTTLEEK